MKQIYTIGRAADNDIRIKDINVSRKHAVIQLTGSGQILLSDCQSRNGTFVNGKRIATAYVREGDRIAFGSYECRLSQLLPRETAVPGAAPRFFSPRFSSAQKLLGGLCILCLLIFLAGVFSEPSSQPSAPSVPRPPSVQDTPLPPPDRQAERTTRQRIEQATVLVLAEKGYGSGFFITPNTLVTNRHVVQNARTVHVGNTFLGRWGRARVTAVSHRQEQDYAVLVSDVSNTSWLPLCPRLERGSKVSSWGYPGFVTDHILGAREIPEVLLTSGEVSAIQKLGGAAHILHTAQIAQGNSGGPLINENGSVVGVNTFAAPDKTLNSQFSIALPAGDLIAFLRANQVPFAEGE